MVRANGHLPPETFKIMFSCQVQQKVKIIPPHRKYQPSCASQCFLGDFKIKIYAVFSLKNYLARAQGNRIFSKNL